MPLALPAIPNLEAELWRRVEEVPPGKVTTFGTLAMALGSRQATRWLATVLLRHRHTSRCGCHRVLRAGGELVASANFSAAAQAARLRAEGVSLAGTRVDLVRYGFHAFTGPPPLNALAEFQRAARKQLVLETRVPEPKRVGGLDVSYSDRGTGVAAYVCVDVDAGTVLCTHKIEREVAFPYVSTFLSFRELPLHFALLEEVKQLGELADVLLVDGAGILHPLQAGIASTLGIVADVPTVGVAKKLLCGTVDLEGLAPGARRPVEYQGQVLGVALRHRQRSARPLFVSPGHAVSLVDAANLVQRLLLGHRLPEPIYWADRLSRAAAR